CQPISGSSGGIILLQQFKFEDEGFTPIELVAFMQFIRMLSRTALPSFLGQQKKGQDASAKSNARNAVTQVESCYADTQDYTQCRSEERRVGKEGKAGRGPGRAKKGGTERRVTTYVEKAPPKSGT